MGAGYVKPYYKSGPRGVGPGALTRRTFEAGASSHLARKAVPFRVHTASGICFGFLLPNSLFSGTPLRATAAENTTDGFHGVVGGLQGAEDLP